MCMLDSSRLPISLASVALVCARQSQPCGGFRMPASDAVDATSPVNASMTDASCCLPHSIIDVIQGLSRAQMSCNNDALQTQLLTVGTSTQGYLIVCTTCKELPCYILPEQSCK